MGEKTIELLRELRCAVRKETKESREVNGLNRVSRIEGSAELAELHAADDSARRPEQPLKKGTVRYARLSVNGGLFM